MTRLLGLMEELLRNTPPDFTRNLTYEDLKEARKNLEKHYANKAIFCPDCWRILPETKDGAGAYWCGECKLIFKEPERGDK